MIVQKLTVSEEKSVKIKAPRDVLTLDIKTYLENQDQKNFVVIALNGSYRVTSMRVIFVGTVNKCPTHPRDVFRHAIMENATGIIICHNHPSGNCTPSEDDKKTTETIRKAGEIVGIDVLDHIIIGKDDYFSFVEHNM